MSEIFKSCSVFLEIEGQERQFRLPLLMIAELQASCKAGLGVIYKRVFAHDFYAEDLVETVRCGLIGGGLERGEAKKIIDRRAVGAEQWPIEVWHDYAMAILAACIHGYEDKSSGKREATETESGSTSPSPTA